MAHSLRCSCARQPALRTVALEPGLPAAACPGCGAVSDELLALLRAAETTTLP